MKIKPTYQWKHYVNVCNHEIGKLVNVLNNDYAVVPPFDSNIKDCVPRLQAASLIKHRIVNKFFDPSVVTRKHLRKVCFDNYIEFDAQLKLQIDHDKDPIVFENYLKARQNFKNMIRQKSYDGFMWKSSPGETYITSKGETSVIAKFDDVNHWTISEDNYDWAVLFIMKNRWLLKMALRHSNVSWRELRFLSESCPESTVEKRKIWILKNLLLEVFTFVNGVRPSSVFKNLQTDRFIGICGMFDVIRQRNIAMNIKIDLAQEGNDLMEYDARHLNDAQATHQKMISDPQFATVDEKNGSDSVLRHLVLDWTYGTPMHTPIKESCPKRVDFDKGKNAFFPKKLASMGCGYTFEVMTMVLLACCRVFSTQARVYGDDIIIENIYVHDLMDLLAAVGFQTNHTKTFINSNFRESCGAFYSDDLGYVKSYEFTYCETFVDVITTLNKLYTLINADQSFLTDALRQCWTSILSLSSIPASLKGYTPYSVDVYERNFDQYIYVNNKSVRRLHNTDVVCKSRYADTASSLSKKLKSYNDSSIFDEFNGAIIIEVQRWEQRLSSKKTDILSQHAARLLTGRPCKRTIKGKGKWCLHRFILLNSGIMIDLRQLGRPSSVRKYPCNFSYNGFLYIEVKTKFHILNLRNQIRSLCDHGC